MMAGKMVDQPGENQVMVVTLMVAIMVVDQQEGNRGVAMKVVTQ